MFPNGNGLADVRVVKWATMKGPFVIGLESARKIVA